MSIEFRNKLEVNTINFNFDNKEKVKDLYIHDSEYVGFHMIMTKEKFSYHVIMLI